MTGPGAPSGLDPEIATLALRRIRALVEGNGEDAASVRVLDAGGSVLTFEATTRLTLKPRLSETSKPGKQTGGETMASREDMKKAAGDLTDHSTSDPEARAAVIQAFRARPDRGFGLDGQSVPLPAPKKTWMVHEKCPVCGGGGAGACRTCNGNGRVQCIRCHGHRQIPCPMCRGQKQVPGPSGQKVNCTRCRGDGRAPCDLCQQTGRIRCRTCSGSGKAPCQPCHGAGWQTHFMHAEIVAETRFLYDRKALPPEVVRSVDSLGAKLAAQGHASIQPGTPAAPAAAGGPPAPGGGAIDIPYRVSLPYGGISFSIKGKPVQARLFGLKGKLLGAPPFLDGLIREGARRLHEAGEGRGNVAEKVRQAASFRAIAETLAAVSSASPRKAAMIVRRAYPFGLSGQMAETLVRDAGAAIRRITRRPCRIGLAAGLGLAAAWLAAWLPGGVREAVLPLLPPAPAMEPASDAAALLLAAIAVYLSIHAAAGLALRRALGNLLKGVPRAVSAGGGALEMAGCVLCVVLLLGFAEAGVQTKAYAAPSWYAHIRALILPE